MRAAAVWPAGELPRTEGTRKLKRRELKRGSPASGTGRRRARRRAGTRSVASVLDALRAGPHARPPRRRLDELGLSSLERVELMMALEEAFQVTIDEGTIQRSARTVADLDALTQAARRRAGPATVAATEPIEFPGWNRRSPARALRRASLPTWILPLGRVFAQRRRARPRAPRGARRPGDLRRQPSEPPGHAGDPRRAARALALPRRAGDGQGVLQGALLSRSSSARSAYLKNSANYYLASLFFNAFPLPQRESGTRQTLRYIGELDRARGYSILIYPEGRRTAGGRDRPLPARRRDDRRPPRRAGRPGPARRPGPDPPSDRGSFRRRGRARVTFGAPMSLKGNDYAELAAALEAP